MVFYSMLNYFKDMHVSSKQLPHFIISAVEHDSVKLVAFHLEKQNLAGTTLKIHNNRITFVSVFACVLYQVQNHKSKFNFVSVISEVTEIPVDQNGVISVTNVIDTIKPNTVLISIMLANNETGVIQVCL
jgi:cysteine sulfinate desulfinase/cysteine desulfurase-like protein